MIKLDDQVWAMKYGKWIPTYIVDRWLNCLSGVVKYATSEDADVLIEELKLRTRDPAMHGEDKPK